MKTTIYYFSGTGNSLAVARDLASNLKGDVELSPIAEELKKEIIDINEDCVGIVYPVYFEGTPLIVSRFIEKINADNGTYFFGVATYGGMAAGAMNHLAAKLRPKGIKLSSGFVIQMPGNYAPMYDAFSKELQDKVFTKEKIKIKEIADIINDRNELPLENGNIITRILLTEIGHRIFTRKFPIQDKNFYANEQCSSCGTCEKVCPVGNIVLENGSPKWQHHCEQCFACFHWCPEKSIQCGSKTVKRVRYHHPEIKLKDILIKKE